MKACTCFCPIHGSYRPEKGQENQEDVNGGMNEFRSSLTSDRSSKLRGQPRKTSIDSKRKQRYSRVELPSNYQNINEQNYSFYVSEYGTVKKPQAPKPKPKPVKKQEFKYYKQDKLKSGKKEDDGDNYKYYENKNIKKTEHSKYRQSVVIHERRGKSLDRNGLRNVCPIHGGY